MQRSPQVTEPSVSLRPPMSWLFRRPRSHVRGVGMTIALAGCTPTGQPLDAALSHVVRSVSAVPATFAQKLTTSRRNLGSPPADASVRRPADADLDRNRDRVFRRAGDPGGSQPHPPLKPRRVSPNPPRTTFRDRPDSQHPGTLAKEAEGSGVACPSRAPKKPASTLPGLVPSCPARSWCLRGCHRSEPAVQSSRGDPVVAARAEPASRYQFRYPTHPNQPHEGRLRCLRSALVPTSREALALERRAARAPERGRRATVPQAVTLRIRDA